MDGGVGCEWLRGCGGSAELIDARDDGYILRTVLIRRSKPEIMMEPMLIIEYAK